LVPFYIFSHESRFVEYNGDEGKLEALKAEYIDIRNRLDSLLEAGDISAYTRKIIMEMSDKVVENLAQKYENVRDMDENVRDMGMGDDSIAKAVGVGDSVIREWFGENKN